MFGGLQSSRSKVCHGTQPGTRHQPILWREHGQVRTLLRRAGANLLVAGLLSNSYGCQALVTTVVSRVLPCFPLATIAVNLGVSLAERGFAKTNPMNAPPPAIGMSDFRC